MFPWVRKYVPLQHPDSIRGWGRGWDLSFGSVGGGSEGRAPGLQRRAGLARIGCGTGSASRLLAAGPGERVPLTGRSGAGGGAHP